MNQVCFTVLVPTHEHASTLPYAVGSALRQRFIGEMEVLIVGDGASSEVRKEAWILAQSDGRVRWLAFPKGMRHGEANRHEALKAANGDIVCYLSDDDLWLPDHLAVMSDVAAGELTHTMPVEILPDGSAHGMPETSAEAMMSGRNDVPLSAVGHTMSDYRMLPEGWAPAPEDMFTDLNMWRKFLRNGARLARRTAPTVLHLASPRRRGWSPEERAIEIRRLDSSIKSNPEAVRDILLGASQTP